MNDTYALKYDKIGGIMDIFFMILIGILGGIIGGMGMGGGTLLIPLLTILLSFEQKIAQAINLIAFIPMSIVACIMHAKAGLLEKKYFFLSIPALVSSIGASILASYLSSNVLKMGFGIFLAVLGVFQLVSAIVKKVKQKNEKRQYYLSN